MIYLYLRWPELAVAGLHHVLEPVPVNALLSQQVVGLNTSEIEERKSLNWTPAQKILLR